jgi:chromosome partitioning protein
MNGLYAANGLIVPLPPNMLDFASSSAFFENCGAICSTIEQYEEKTLDLDFVKVVPTRCPVIADSLVNTGDNELERTEKRQSIKILNCMIDTFGDCVSNSLLLSSEAIREASKDFETVYERDNWEASRQTVRRCLSSVNAVCGEIERDIFNALDKRYEEWAQEQGVDSEAACETV